MLRQIIYRGMVMRLSATSKWFQLITLNYVRLHVKLITSQTKLDVYCKHDSSCSHEEVSFVPVDDLDNISILHTVPLTIFYRQFRFLIGKYYVAEV